MPDDLLDAHVRYLETYALDTRSWRDRIVDSSWRERIAPLLIPADWQAMYTLSAWPIVQGDRSRHYGYDITVEERMAIGGYIVAENYANAAATAKRWGWKKRAKRKNGDPFFVDANGTTIAFSEFRWLTVQNLRGKKLYVGRGFKKDPDFKKVHLAKAVRRGASLIGRGEIVDPR